MAEKKIIVGGQSWTVADSDAEKVLFEIEQAMTNGTTARLSLLADNRPVTVFFNGKTTGTVVFDDGSGPRPTEISG